MGQPDHIDKQEEIDLRLTPNLRRHIFGFDVYILESTNADAPTFTYYEPAAAGPQTRHKRPFIERHRQGNDPLRHKIHDAMRRPQLMMCYTQADQQ